MAIKHLISPGIGFIPGSVKFIVTRGLLASAVVVTRKSSGMGAARNVRRRMHRRR